MKSTQLLATMLHTLSLVCTFIAGAAAATNNLALFAFFALMGGVSWAVGRGYDEKRHEEVYE
jgi:hypothetical protein